MAMADWLTVLFLLSSGIFFFDSVARAKTHSGDYAVLNELRRNIRKSPAAGEADDDPCGSKWDHIRCTTEGLIHMIQLQGLGLNGTLPFNLNNLTMLIDLCLMLNNFTDPLSSLSGFPYRKRVFLDFNLFDTIPFDFFTGLASIYAVAELAGHYTERDPHQRPEMDHAVNALLPLVAKWKPKKEIVKEEVTRRPPLLQMVKDRQTGKSSFSMVIGPTPTIADDSRRNPLPSGRISLDTTTFDSSDGW